MSVPLDVIAVGRVTGATGAVIYSKGNVTVVRTGVGVYELRLSGNQLDNDETAINLESLSIETFAMLDFASSTDAVKVVRTFSQTIGGKVVVYLHTAHAFQSRALRVVDRCVDVVRDFAVRLTLNR